jgi:hypothetical protein
MPNSRFFDNVEFRTLYGRDMSKYTIATRIQPHNVHEHCRTWKAIFCQLKCVHSVSQRLFVVSSSHNRATSTPRRAAPLNPLAAPTHPSVHPTRRTNPPSETAPCHANQTPRRAAPRRAALPHLAAPHSLAVPRRATPRHPRGHNWWGSTEWRGLSGAALRGVGVARLCDEDTTNER